VRCRDAASISFVVKVRGEVFSHFQAVAVLFTVACGIGCLAYQDEFFANNSLDVKENDEHALDFSLHLSRLFRSQ
jgi:hypothetical protein